MDWARFRRRDFENSLTAYHTHIKNQHKVTFRPPHRKKNACPQLSNPAHTWRKDPICKQLSVVLLIPSGIPHIFLAILVDGQVDGAEGAAADLLLDQVLVDAVLGGAVILAVAVLGARVERFLLGHQQHVRAELLTYVLFNLYVFFSFSICLSSPISLVYAWPGGFGFTDFDLSCGGRCPAVVSEGALVGWS